MKIINTLFKSINNYRDGYHLNSRYWQDFKKSLPALPQHLFDVAIGMILGDAGMFKVSKEAGIKFEQGHLQEAFLLHLFNLFSTYCFMLVPGKRMQSEYPNLIKSLWFKTFSHYSFTKLWDIFYVNGVKTIQSGLVLNYVTPVSLAYWIMCDGSLDGNTMILHTQGFTLEENNMLSKELNEKFDLHSTVIRHKGKYSVIKIPYTDAKRLRELIKPHMIPSMYYKVPK